MARAVTGIMVVAACLVMGAPQALAQFHSGSNGSYGPLNVTSNTTLDLPPDGIFNCTTITVNDGVALSFKRNSLNTPVYLLATGSVSISGRIDVSGSGPAGPGLAGLGGPGGFDGGAAPNGPGATGGDGLGPGGGRFPWGSGAYAGRPSNNATSLDGTNYGNSLVMPLLGGSGAGGGRCGTTDYGGAGGGGAILIASDTRIDTGNNCFISANGSSGACNAGYGSGGAIRIVSPIVTGQGTLQAFEGGFGGDGWIRVDVTNRFQYALRYAGGSVSVGKLMQVFPANLPRLDIIQAAGTNIAEGFPTGVLVQLPLGSPTNQTVTVQARNFAGIVPITVAVTPDAAASTRYDAQIDMGGSSVAQVEVPVVIPAGTACKIYTWTR